MSWATTLLKVGLTAGVIGVTVFAAREIRAAQRKRLGSRKSGDLTPLPAPDGDDCSSRGPLYDAQGTITGFWAPGAQGQPKCVPQCVDGYAAKRVGDGDFDWICAPIEKPEEFPPSEPCLVGVYSRMPIPPEPQLYEAASPNGRLALKDLRMHLDYRAQPHIALDLADFIEVEPSVRSVMVRRALDNIAPDCNWWLPESDMTPAQQLVWQSAMKLEMALERDIGWVHPAAARKNMVPREYLGMPSTGDLHLAPGQAIEILVVEGPQMLFGEHLIGKQVAPGIVQIVDTFRGQDVAPQFGAYHGFHVGTQVGIETTAPTSAYRVYPKEWT